MYKNYFYLFRVVHELNSLIKDKNIVDCFSQERDKLFMHIPLIDQQYYHLIISTSQQEFHIESKNDFKKAKRNIINFFTEYLPDKISSIKIASGERIIKFELEHGNFLVVFRGNRSNCYLQIGKNILPFKKADSDYLNKLNFELDSNLYLSTYEEFISQFKNLHWNELKLLPFLTKDMLDNTVNNNPDDFIKLINEFISGKIAVGLNPKKNDVFFQPLSFINTKEKLEIELFDTYLEAISKYLQLKYSINTNNKQTIVNFDKIVEKEIERSANKLNKLKFRVESGCKADLYRKYGDLLLNEINNFSKGIKEIVITDLAKNEEYPIKLDPKLSPKQNIDFYYEKARSEKIEFEKSKEMFKETEIKFTRMKEIKELLLENPNEDIINELKKELRVSNNQKLIENKKNKIPFRHFIIEGKYNFYIGKDSKNNDMLTTKFAKQNDYWFHARSVAGSHGVLRVENTKEAIPKKILEKAASITAFYSKAKTSKVAPVTYTFKKYVVKNSRHEPGQVSVLKENVLLVRPEIPNDCEYIED